MFKITGGRGFHITFENGYTVSVQWGSGNYCDNHDYMINDFIEGDKVAGTRGSTTAEVAVWKDKGKLIAMPQFGGDTVGGYYTPKQVLDLMIWAEKQES